MATVNAATLRLRIDKTIIHDFSATVEVRSEIRHRRPDRYQQTTDNLNLLMRFYEISGGTISIDGVVPNRCTLECARSSSLDDGATGCGCSSRTVRIGCHL